MERHLTKVIAGTYFLRLHYKVCWDPWAAPSHVKQILVAHGSRIPGSVGGRGRARQFRVWFVRLPRGAGRQGRVT